MAEAPEDYASDNSSYDSLDNFSHSEDEQDERPTSPEISRVTPRSSVSTSTTVLSFRKKAQKSGQPTPNRGETDMGPSQIIPHDADLSSSEDDTTIEDSSTHARIRGKRKKRRRLLSDKENSLESIEDIKSMLITLCKKVDRNNKALREIEKQQQQSASSVSSSSGSTSKSSKRPIPLIVRQEVRRCYKALLASETEEDFSGWCLDLGESIKSDQNDAVVQKLVKEVRGLNPTFNAADIRDAAYRFYKSKCEDASLKRNGKEAEKKTQRRRHERITRKRKERESAIQKNSKLTEDQKRKWLTVMTNEYMSSEESAEEDSIIVHPLPWRSEYVNKMFRKIDKYNTSKKSPQALRQMKARNSGTLSSRPRPTTDQPSWAIQSTVV